MQCLVMTAVRKSCLLSVKSRITSIHCCDSLHLVLEFPSYLFGITADALRTNLIRS